LIDESQETGLIVRDQSDLVPQMVMSLQVAKANYTQLRSFVQSVMVNGQDYGTIPGTDKPTLLKNGADKLLMVYGYAPTFSIIDKVEDWEKGFFRYVVKCTVVSKRTGHVVADGTGECNSRESKYGDRWVFENQIPEGMDKEALQSRTNVSKKTGRPYTQYKVPNPEIFNLVNTVLKMAEKRALVAATLHATAASDLFTQDMEDIVGLERDMPAPRPAQPAPESHYDAPEPEQDAPPPVEEAPKPRQMPPRPAPKGSVPLTPEQQAREDLLVRWRKCWNEVKAKKGDIKPLPADANNVAIKKEVEWWELWLQNN
jgi:hypothetical protein